MHLSDLLERLHHDGIQFRSLTEGIDTSTPGGKLVFHVFAAVAEFTRDLIRENTCAGLQAARERVSVIGRPRSLSDQDIAEAYQDIFEYGLTPLEAATEREVSLSTLYRGLRRLGLNEAA